MEGRERERTSVSNERTGISRHSCLLLTIGVHQGAG